MIKFIFNNEPNNAEFHDNLFKMNITSNSTFQFIDEKEPNVVYILTESTSSKPLQTWEIVLKLIRI